MKCICIIPIFLQIAFPYPTIFMGYKTELHYSKLRVYHSCHLRSWFYSWLCSRIHPLQFTLLQWPQSIFYLYSHICYVYYKIFFYFSYKFNRHLLSYYLPSAQSTKKKTKKLVILSKSGLWLVWNDLVLSKYLLTSSDHWIILWDSLFNNAY